MTTTLPPLVLQFWAAARYSTTNASGRANVRPPRFSRLPVTLGTGRREAECIHNSRAPSSSSAYLFSTVIVLRFLLLCSVASSVSIISSCTHPVDKNLAAFCIVHDTLHIPTQPVASSCGILFYVSSPGPVGSNTLLCCGLLVHCSSIYTSSCFYSSGGLVPLSPLSTSVVFCLLNLETHNHF